MCDLMRTLNIILIIAVVATFAIVFFVINSGNSNSNIIVTAQDNVAVNKTFISELSAIANNKSLAASVGTGITSNLPAAKSNYTLLKSGGKPEILYIGADYCPFCAITRWGLILALMRFGNFTNLHYMTSSSSDAYANSPTFTFYNSSYNSNIINFTEVELQTNQLNTTTSNYPQLQSLTPFQRLVFGKYNKVGSIPFIDFGNYSIQIGAEITPQLISNLNWQQVENNIKTPTTPLAQGIIGMANIYTEQICTEINNTASACKTNN